MDRSSASNSLENGVDSLSTYFGTAPTMLKQTEIIYLAMIVREGKKDCVDNTKIQAMKSAARKIAEGNLPLVAYIAKRYRNGGVDFMQLVSAGNLGLMRAAYDYDPNRINPATNEPFRFSTYAGRCIKQHIKNEIIDELAARVHDHEDNEQSGLLVSMESVFEKRVGGRSHDEPIQSTGFGLHYEIEEALSLLNEKERELIEIYYGLGSKPETLKKMGEYLGLTRSTMSLRHTKILDKIRSRY